MSFSSFNMNRSQSQVARAYSPGSLFTFEGGAVACMAYPDQANRDIGNNGAEGGLTPANQAQITAIISEYAQAWLNRGRNARNKHAGWHPKLYVDEAVLGDSGEVDIKTGHLRFQSPDFASFVPFPLSFRCARSGCNLHRECTRPDTVAEEMESFRHACPTGAEGCANNWRQLDFVMAHWSGEVVSPSPTRLHVRDDGNLTKLDECQQCARKAFRWIGIGTGALSNVRLACTHCGEPRDLLMKDPYTLKALAGELRNNNALHAEINMEPISYRASAAHYPHGDRVLLFSEDGTMRMLEASRVSDLSAFLTERYGLPPGTNLTLERKIELLRQAGIEDEWHNCESFKEMLSSLDHMPPSQQVDKRRKALQDTIHGLEKKWMRDVFSKHSGSSPLTHSLIDGSKAFPSKFDPVRMTVEHEAFRIEKVSAEPLPDGRFRSVSVEQLDAHTRPDGMPPQALDRLHGESRRWLDDMGIDEMRIVRDVRVCDFTFGYTRTDSKPLIQRDKAPNTDLPVRLRFFPKVKVDQVTAGQPQMWRIPVLSIVSANEGIYARLNPAAVAAWIEANNLDLPTPSQGMSLGGRLLAQAVQVQTADPPLPGRFEPFLDGFRKRGEVSEIAFPHVYTLLHTMAHTAIIQASALSGLDLGSFAEHLFVPDLAFLIYRRGTTMDLANITSMWRDRGSEDQGNEFLARMGAPAALRCGSEGSCVQRGGACPDCIMIPETSCLTRNELLSRSSLVGRGRPQWASWQNGRQEMVGYYDVVAQMRAAAAAGQP